jgi:hypothetical protein
LRIGHITKGWGQIATLLIVEYKSGGVKMSKINKEALKELDVIFEKHKKDYPNKKMTEKELDKLLNLELKPELVRKILKIDKKGKFTAYNNIDELKKEIKKVKEQNEFLKDLYEGLKDVKAGRYKVLK